MMSVSKHEIPLNLLLAIEAKIIEHELLIHHEDTENCYYNLKAHKTESPNYFKILHDGKKRIDNFRNGNFAFEFKPTNDLNTNSQLSQGNLAELIDNFNIWIKIIDTYDRTKSVHDNPILEKYQRDFESRFSFTQEDNDADPFDFEQQLFLDSYLNQIVEKLEDYKVDRDENEVKRIVALQRDAKDIQNFVTRESKKKIKKRLTNLWAKAQVIGLDVIKGILVDFTVEIAKRLLLGNNT